MKLIWSKYPDSSILTNIDTPSFVVVLNPTRQSKYIDSIKKQTAKALKQVSCSTHAIIFLFIEGLSLDLIKDPLVQEKIQNVIHCQIKDRLDPIAFLIMGELDLLNPENKPYQKGLFFPIYNEAFKPCLDYLY